MIGVLVLLFVVLFVLPYGAARTYGTLHRRRRRERYQQTLRNIDRMERQLWPEWFREPRRFGRVRIPGTYKPTPYVYTVSQSAYSPPYVQIIRSPYEYALAPGTKWMVDDDSAVAYLARVVH